MIHCRYITLSLSKIRIRLKEKKKRTIQTLMQVSLHVQQTFTQVSLRIQKQSICWLHPNGLPVPEFLTATSFPTIGLCAGLVAIVPNELSELVVAFGAGNVKPIIISVN
jgi:exosortase/archaeosortase